jgi:hypothetical protein
MGPLKVNESELTEQRNILNLEKNNPNFTARSNMKPRQTQTLDLEEKEIPSDKNYFAKDLLSFAQGIEIPGLSYHGDQFTFDTNLMDKWGDALLDEIKDPHRAENTFNNVLEDSYFLAEFRDPTQKYRMSLERNAPMGDLMQEWKATLGINF